MDRLNFLVKGLMVTCVNHLKSILYSLSHKKDLNTSGGTLSSGSSSGCGSTSSSSAGVTKTRGSNQHKASSNSRRDNHNSNNSCKSEKRLVVDGSVDSRSDGSEEKSDTETNNDSKSDAEDNDADEDDGDDDENYTRQPEDRSIMSSSSQLSLKSSFSWSIDEREKLFHLVAKVFYPHFPPYAIQKHLHQNRLDDLTPKEAALMGSYCDLHDPVCCSFDDI